MIDGDELNLYMEAEEANKKNTLRCFTTYGELLAFTVYVFPYTEYCLILSVTLCCTLVEGIPAYHGVIFLAVIPYLYCLLHDISFRSVYIICSL